MGRRHRKVKQKLLDGLVAGLAVGPPAALAGALLGGCIAAPAGGLPAVPAACVGAAVCGVAGFAAGFGLGYHKPDKEIIVEGLKLGNNMASKFPL